MSLKIRLKNLGILKHAEFSLGDLTLICGENNTGKTYAAYALHGFLQLWLGLIDFEVSDAQVRRLLTDGGIKIRLGEYVKKADRLLAAACKRYTEQLSDVFAADELRFRNSEFHIQTGAIDIRNKEFKREMGIVTDRFLTYSKETDSEELTVSLLVSQKIGRKTDPDFKKIDPDFARSAINSIIGYFIFSDSFPYPFISSAERTGATIFRRELNSNRNHPYEKVGRANQRYLRYPLPVKTNVGFMGELEDIAKHQSFIAKEHPEVLDDFADIIGGEYTITQDDQLYYTPKGYADKLTMVESSSAVRSLLDLGFYLRHVAQKGTCLW